MTTRRDVRSWLSALCALLALAVAPPAWAQSPADDAPPESASEAKERQRRIDLEALAAERKARQALEPNRVRARIQRYLAAAAEATDEAEPGEAAALLNRLEGARMNPHERALVQRLKGFVLYTDGDVEGAIEAFKVALAQEMLNVDDEARLRFNIAQLYASLQKWPETIQAIHEWLPWVREVDPLAYYLLAIAHFQLDEFDEATRWAEKAVDSTPEPKEGWLQLLAALYVQEEDYAKATPVLEELVLRYPRKLYWVQLSLIYGALENYKHSLAVQQVAYLQGLLTDDKELRRLARSYLFAELPYQAAKVLEKGIAEGRIEPDAEAYEMLANSWVAAREYDRSLEPLQKAASLSDDGDLYVRLGQVHLQREEWSQAAEMFHKALEKGGLDQRGNALLLLGISYYNDERVSQARRYFARAVEDDRSRPEAQRWLKHLDTEAGRAAESDETAAAQPAPDAA